MPDVFLSYSRVDQAIARRFAEGLQAEGFSVWWDQSLNAGEAFDRVTEKALAEARAVVVLWSKHSVDSNWVRAEATQARADNRLVPVMIEPCKRPIMFELTHTADLVGWNGAASDPRWRSVVDGLRKSADMEATAPSTPHPAHRAPRKLAGWIAAGIALALAAGLAWFLNGRSADTPTAKADPSVAVLPFENLSSDPEQGYFADGLTEEILDVLAAIPELKVTARTSSFAFKGKTQDLRAIGAALGVAHVLEGSVRRSGDQLRIVAQLISTDTGFHFWSKTYDQPFADIFGIQEDIARQVAETLQVSLGVGQLGNRPGMTRNVEAYDAYLEAQVEWNKATPAGWRRAVALEEKALAIDPSFAICWADVALAYSFMPGMVGGDAAEWRRKADAALEQARRLEPDLPFLHAVLFTQAWTEHRYDDALAHQRDLQKAQAKFGEAVDSANIPVGLLGTVGRIQEEIAGLEEIKARDPLNPAAYAALVVAYDQAGDFKAAFAEAERGYPSGGPNQIYYAVGGLIAGMGARDREQIIRWQGALTHVLPDPALKEFNTQMRVLLDDPAGALRVLHRHANDPSIGAQLQDALPLWMAYHGDAAGALKALRAVRKLRPGAGGGLWSSVYRDVRKLPEFKQLVQDDRLVEIWQKTGWGDYCKPTTGDNFECT